VKKLIILLIVCLSIVLVLVYTQKPSEVSEPSSEPSTEPNLLDSDGDGMSDWFEGNIAKTDPLVRNDRYLILFDGHAESDNMEGLVEETRNFWVEKGKVPSENVVMVKVEASPEKKNTGVELEEAIYQVAEKADENDIVFLGISGHGYVISNFVTEEDAGKFGPEGSYIYIEDGQLYHENGGYILLDEWIDKINAKAVVVRIMACGCKAALSVLKDGPCPRIIFVHSAGEFTGALGEFPDYAVAADTKYGNGDGYVSVGEISNWIDNDPMWGPDWGELYQEGRSHLEAEGYSKMSDTSGIAYEIYLTDYKIPG